MAAVFFAAFASALLCAEVDVSRIPDVARSADGFVMVVAVDDPADPVGFRLPILRFAADEVRMLVQAYDLPHPKRSAPGLVIHAQQGATNDVRVVVRRERRRDGTRLTRIILPSPGYSDLDELRYQIAAALFPTSTPPWLVQGALRAADSELARMDTCFVTELWRAGRLPFFPALCTDLRRCRGEAAALPGFLAAWMREKKLVKKAFARMEAGEPWDGGRLAEELTRETDPVLQDRACDERFVTLLRRVFSPGRADPWDWSVFTSRLLIYPLFFDKKFSRNRTFCSFREAVGMSKTDMHVRLACGKKALGMPYLALGHGEKMQSVAKAYAQFLFAVAAGWEEKKLLELLEAAEKAHEEGHEKSREDDNGQR
ncbi:MAG: hypothetical protein MJ138_02665 [Kiritimatiellae bacterium]|nr:hypothetical protein [Kiritimatiellia bacterium]